MSTPSSILTSSASKLVLVLAVLLAVVAEWNFDLTHADAANSPKGKAPIVLYDNFKGFTGALQDHAPKTDLIGNGWQSVSGSWIVNNGKALETTGYSAPQITSINPNASNYDVSIDVTWLGGSEAGLVFRYLNDANYYSFVTNGKSLFLRKTVDGVTTVLHKKGHSWKKGKTQTITVSVDGPELIGSVDKKTLKVSDSDLELAREVGAIVQRVDNDSFKSIEVRALGPEVLPPPILLPSIGDSVIFDEFVGSGDLSAHSPDKAPVGAAWLEHGGDWEIASGATKETTGIPWADLRTTIESGISDADIYTNLTWNGGRAGVVYRYTDESNWWMTWTDGNFLLTGSLDTSGGFRLWDVTPYFWGPPGTAHDLRVRLTGVGIRVYVDYGDVAVVKVLSDLHQSATRVGLFDRGGGSNTFENFVVGIAPPPPVPDTLPPVIPPPTAATPPATPPGFELFDSFSNYPHIWLGAHSPDLAPDFRTWNVNSGIWEANFDNLTELSGANSDQRAVIDTGVEDHQIEMEATWEAGRVGVVFRYRDERNWGLVWYDGGGNIVVGRVSEGTFEELARKKLKIKSGKRLKFKIETTENIANIKVNNKKLGDFDVSMLPNATRVGLFHRNVEAATFDNLSLDAPASQPDPGGINYSTVILDTFSDVAPVSLNDVGRVLDIAPVGTSWTEASGDWHVSSGSAFETLWDSVGYNADFRSWVPGVSGDQKISADITYNGGIAGVTFRYQDEVNWYMFWYDGTNIVFGKNVGGFFTLLDIKLLDWGALGTTRTLSVTVSDEDITGFVSGVDVLTLAGESDLASESGAGLFARRAPSVTTFGNFLIEEPAP